jgi:phosphatidylethanolamine/phosphatidyl-N-methylethanolamine N-methyltransferase
MIFLKEAIQNWKDVGTIFPCSQNSVQACLNHINIDSANSVVELGCGTGVFTKKIQEAVGKEKTFFALEINKNLVDSAKKRSPDTHIYHASAEDLEKYLKKHNLQKSDCIISTLPWAIFSKRVQKTLISVINNNLSENGEFITIAYTLGTKTKKGRHFRRLLHQNFSLVKQTPIVWKNIPPSIFYYCKL